MTWPISFDRPAWLWLLAAVPVIALLARWSLAGLERWRRIVAVTLRCVVVALLALALARVQYVQRHDHVAVMFVLDKSRSIPDDLRRAAQEYIQQVTRQADSEDRVGVISFDGRADVDLIPSKGGATAFGFGMASAPDRTDIGAGMRLALAAFPEGFGRRVVVLTDGNENTGDLSAELETAVANGVAVDVVPLRYRHANEILFDRIVVRTHADRDTEVPVRLVLKSRQPGRARISLEHNGAPVPLADDVVELDGGMRPTVVPVPVQLFGGGVHRFDARLTPIPAGADSITENNRATAFTFVEDHGRVLLLTQAGSTDDVVLRDALDREKVDVEMQDVDEVEVDLLELQKYGVVVLANIAADAFTEAQHKALASYVRDFGGGLIMTGGNESFGAGGWIGKPLEEVSPVSFDIRHKKMLPRGALAIIMHSCEFPDANKWGERVAVAAVETISSLDYLGVICYNPMVGGPNWDVPMAPATNKPAIIRKIQQMQIGDMPDFGTTMASAVDKLMACRDASQRHMIIISDGDPSPPSPLTIRKMIDNKITCSTVGIGYGVHVMEQTLRDIATRTNGRFYACKNPQKLPQIFVKEAKVVKRPLIDEKPFTPRLAFPFAPTMTGVGAEGVPALGGLVLTEAKADIVLPLVRRAKDGTDDPVFAHWQYEMGKMAVFTSGWWPKWGGDWAAWQQFGKFWAQTVRWAMRQPGSANFEVVTRLEGNTGKVAIEALNKDASYLNFLQINGLVTLPSMESEPLRLAQTGPGQYEATFDVPDDGNYLVNLRYADPDGKIGLIRTGLSVPYSPEFRQLETNVSLLERVVQRTGGRMLAMDPQTDEVFSRDLPLSVSRQPFWWWIVAWLLLPMFLLDVASRRLASTVALSVYVELAVFTVLMGILYAARASVWGYVGALLLAEAVGWSIRYRAIEPTIRFFTSSVTALSRAGQRSAAALTQLKGVRERVRGDLEGAQADEEAAQTERLEPVADRAARFDAGQEGVSRPAGDLSKDLGGAQTVIEEQRHKEQMRPKRGAKPGEPGDLASRLREAKRRAREQIEERQDGKD